MSLVTADFQKWIGWQTFLQSLRDCEAAIWQNLVLDVDGMVCCMYTTHHATQAHAIWLTSVAEMQS